MALFKRCHDRLGMPPDVQDEPRSAGQNEQYPDGPHDRLAIPDKMNNGLMDQ